jgi:predicted PurR-regulated permease PerM
MGILLAVPVASVIKDLVDDMLAAREPDVTDTDPPTLPSNQPLP